MKGEINSIGWMVNMIAAVVVGEKREGGDKGRKEKHTKWKTGNEGTQKYKND